ncbi:conserved hypothetical protein [Hyella patelloides LEGE 07179]|uniref:Uncharacterized protein n=1 Tax=Hyella patelloides LEGE 07179 TaxID=945734 RepID=A0A563VP43_9CYAN|nr:hypothetical protein [Hyella patelloides]VEP13242.1 conserved hypothetical protein [Hyella patelloides LEGE 07179]
MAKKAAKLVQNIKKFAYVIVLCLSAIAVVVFVGMSSHTASFTQASNFQSSREKPANPAMKEFPIGWIDRIEKPETPGKVANEGINLLIPYTHSYQQETIETYLDNAQKNGIKVFLEPYREPVETGDAAAVTEFVRTYKQHPAVAGWYAYDEPILATRVPVPPEILEITYQAIKAEDPKRPVAVVFPGSQIDKVPQYRNAMDICMIDRYPFFYPKPEFSNLSDFGQWMEEAASFSGDQPFWPVLQGFGEQENGKPKFKRRLPTAAEERYMIYTAVLAGADGLIFYGHHWTQQSWVDSILTPLISEFREYLPIVEANLIAGNSQVNQDDVQTLLYQNPSNQQYLLIAVHHGRGKVRATIGFESLEASNQAKVLAENRDVELIEGGIEDTFDSYAVHIYEIS